VVAYAVGICTNSVQGAEMPSFIAKDKTIVHYESYGSGKPILLIHGWGLSRVWGCQISEFSREHRVITVDLRGHGESGPPDFNLDTLKGDVLTAIKELGIRDVTLVGWSMGASVAIKLMAEDKPEEVDSLVIVAGTPMLTAAYTGRGEKMGISKRIGVIGLLLHLMARYTREVFSRKGFLRDRLWIIKNCGPWANFRTLWGYMKTMVETDLAGILNNIDVPTMILHGDRDILCPVEGAYRMAERIKGSRLVILEGDDHTLCLTDPERVNEKIREFVHKLRPS
jgi:pimeloyl-[acyl-carrier protein] methyl ester esterase